MFDVEFDKVKKYSGMLGTESDMVSSIRILRTVWKRGFGYGRQ